MNSKAQSYNLVFVTEFNGPSEPKTTAVRYKYLSILQRDEIMEKKAVK